MTDNIENIKDESNVRSRTFTIILPIIFFVLTVCTTVVAGVLLTSIKLEFSTSLSKGLPFALAMLSIIGSHALGHYITARKKGIFAYFPYFVPKPSITGTAGAYTKIHWPISDRQSLLRVFTIGPIAGFCISWLLFFIGLPMSEIVEVKDEGLILSDSLITYLSSLMVIGQLPHNQDVLLHPIAFAGWVGLYYNFWHLLPIGKLDGGRIIYGLFGYTSTKWISMIFIILLICLGWFWPGWIVMALFGVICMIGLRNQYVSEYYSGTIDKTTLMLVIISLVIFIISFPIIPASIS